MSWVWVVLLSKCQKQKLNKKTSNEYEIVGVSNYPTNIIWVRMFLEDQGFLIKENIIFQDNQSVIKMYNNGKKYSGHKIKHMNNNFLDQG